MEWWKRGNTTLSNNKNFLRIVDFYLFNCPVDKKSKTNQISVRNETFKGRKITDKTLRALLVDMKRCIDYYETVNLHDNVQDKVIAIESSRKFSNNDFQLAVFCENTDLGKTKTIYYTIRNALAHGAFSIKKSSKDNIYFFENKYNGIIKAQFRLNESTLIKWIELVNKYSK